MKRIKLIWIVFAGLLFSISPALSQEVESTSYIVVLLEDISVSTADSSDVRLMFGSVSASGSRLQKHRWPGSSWIAAPSNQSVLPNENDALPVFALPEDQLGDSLSFSILALDNRIEDEALSQFWVQQNFPAVIEAATGPMALWASDSSLTPETQTARVAELASPLLGENELLGVFAVQFSQANDWGVQETSYQAVVESDSATLTVSYRIARVNVANNLKIRVVLKEALSSESASFSAQSQSGAQFSGESLNLLTRQLPFSDTYELEPNTPLLIDEVLFDGAAGPFLYLNLETQFADTRLEPFTQTWLPDAPQLPVEIVLNTANGAQLTLEVEISE